MVTRKNELQNQKQRKRINIEKNGKGNFVQIFLVNTHQTTTFDHKLYARNCLNLQLDYRIKVVRLAIFVKENDNGKFSKHILHRNML